jgi:hypothetical protein
VLPSFKALKAAILKILSILTAVALVTSSTLAVAETTVAPRKAAAEITFSSGKVLLNQGEGFVAAVPETPLAVGDKLMVGEGAQAEIVYAETGCKLTLNEKSVVTITAQPPCKKGETLAMSGQVFVTPTLGGVSGGDMSKFLVVVPVVTVVGLVTILASTHDEPTFIPVSGP